MRKPACWRQLLPQHQQNMVGPYECSRCHGQVMLDESFIILTEQTWCPYCGTKITEISDVTVTNFFGYRLRDGGALSKFIAPTPPAPMPDHFEELLNAGENPEFIDGMLVVYSHYVDPPSEFSSESVMVLNRQVIKEIQKATARIPMVAQPIQPEQKQLKNTA
jgi:DNA-directed RNA polymerase subunit RPC12/RpoP